MEADIRETEAMIQRGLNQAVAAHHPPAGLKRAIAERIAAEQAGKCHLTGRAGWRPWLRRGVVAAAAAGLLAAAAWLVLGNGSAPSAYAELMDAAQNTSSAQWVHSTAQFKRTQAKFDEAWIRLRPFRVLTKQRDGTFRDLDGKILRHYDPSTKTLTIKETSAASNMPELLANKTLSDLLDLQIEQAERKGAKVAKSREGGLLVYTVGSGRNPCKYFVDPATRRILRIVERFPGPSGQVDTLTKQLDYPKTGPTDIYALGVPRDAKVVDLTGGKEPTPTRAADAARSPLELLTEAVHTSKAAEWVHFRLDDGSGEPAEVWIAVSPHRQVWRQAGGVWYVDGAKRLHYEYDATSKTLTISPLQHFAQDILNKRSFLELVLAHMERLKASTGAELTRTRERIDGKELVVYRYASAEPEREEQMVVQVDPAVRRVVSMKLSGHQWPKPLAMRLDYPPAGPTDVYAAGVPRDAKVVDLTADQEPTK